METLAFIHASEAYEDLSPAPELRDLRISSPALLGALSTVVVAGAVLGAAPDAHALVERGDSGLAVRQVQRALVNAGFNPGSADGVFGSRTEAAVLAFQRSKRLSVDGVVGPNTASALGLNPDDYGGAGGTGGRPPGTVTISTNGGGLNVRSGPGTGFPVIDFLFDGDTVRVVGSSGGWYQLTAGGWIASDWTVEGGGGAGGGGGGGDVVVSTNGGGLNARFGPGFEYGVATTYGDGTGLFTTGRVSNGWVELTNGLWVDGEWLS